MAFCLGRMWRERRWFRGRDEAADLLWIPCQALRFRCAGFRASGQKTLGQEFVPNVTVDGVQPAALLLQTSYRRTSCREESDIGLSLGVVDVDGDLRSIIGLAHYIQIDNCAQASVRIARNFSGQAMDSDRSCGRYSAVFNLYGCCEGNSGQGRDGDTGEGVIRSLDEAGDEEGPVGRLEDSLREQRLRARKQKEEGSRQNPPP